MRDWSQRRQVYNNIQWKLPKMCRFFFCTHLFLPNWNLSTQKNESWCFISHEKRFHIKKSLRVESIKYLSWPHFHLQMSLNDNVITWTDLIRCYPILVGATNMPQLEAYYIPSASDIYLGKICNFAWKIIKEDFTFEKQKHTIWWWKCWWGYGNKRQKAKKKVW
jgi:hypothetical protein